ncbi:MAG: hypothetical protein K940chlam1_01097, partial [Candidatus Anoxychlamydiales bacterium]|nr:hypothetical protein [Candidatus Anoxychlamydiales bacterium]NGX35210.1 hypothetical protein [Candidatus Anoxychlamydiales bacterium]
AFNYFYQGLEKINIKGCRPSEARFKNYSLANIIKPHHEILDIGANCCFLSILCAKKAKHIDCIEHNPFLINIGKITASHLKVKNISFFANDFLSFKFKKKYDIVMSFANHNTDDKGSNKNLRTYLEQLHNLLKPKGILLFESHCGDINNENFEKTINALDDIFIMKRNVYFERNLFFACDNRLFYTFEKKRQNSSQKTRNGPIYWEGKKIDATNEVKTKISI